MDTPGVVVTADDTDVDGVRGVGFTYTEPLNSVQHELVVDPGTGVVLGGRELVTRDVDGIPAGTVVGQSTSTRTLVDAVPASFTTGPLTFHCVSAPDQHVTCEKWR